MKTTEITVLLSAPDKNELEAKRDVLMLDIENLLYEKLCTFNIAFEVTKPKYEKIEK